MRYIFVADLHIDIGEVERLQAFAQFLATEEGHIYIMGDLFNFWIGNSQSNLGYVRKFLRTLRELIYCKPIFFLGGNRDFLFVPFFEKRLQGQVIHDGHSLQLGGHRVLLYHGDGLCTGDEDYLKIKKLLRRKRIYYLSRFMPSSVCIKIGQKLRQKSRQAIQHKKKKDMDLDDDHIFSLLQKQQADIMICGHTHKPEIKELGHQKRIYVLPECKNYSVSYLQWDNNEFTYKSANYG